MKLLLATPLFFVSGFVLQFLSQRVASDSGAPFALILSSFAANFFGIALALALLSPGARGLRTFGVCAIFGGAAHAGIFLGPGHTESFKTVIALWAVWLLPILVLLVANASLVIFCGRFQNLPRQICTVLAVILATGLFWSKSLIEMASQYERASERLNGRGPSEQIADSVVKLSPPMLTATAWYGASDASRRSNVSESTRFDVIRSPLTYNVWIGSYQAIPYPEVWPSRETGAPGLVLTYLLWGIPLLILFDRLSKHKAAIATK